MHTTRTFGTVPIAVTSRVPESPHRTHLVFIHMSWGGAWAFKRYMKFFAGRGYACHAVDLRGHGNSGGSVEGASMQDYVNDVRTAVTGLGLENTVVIGHSMGGLISLMYGAQFKPHGIASLDGSPPKETQGTNEEKSYPPSYVPTDAGMPKNPLKAMSAFSDLPPMRLMQMKFALGVESGVARSDRKRGISIPKEQLSQPLLFIGAERGASVPFGIGIEKMSAQAAYYGTDAVEIKGASHPGLLIGVYWKRSAEAILQWLQKNQW